MADKSTTYRDSEQTKVLPESKAVVEILIDLKNSSRIALLDRLEILDAPAERTFEVLTELSNRILATPVSLISLVTPSRQFFVSSCGLSEPYCSERETDLSHSFCQHVVKRNEPLVISDARTHPLVKDNLAIPNLNVVAYLGVPLVYQDGTVLGSFCAIDDSAREWTETDLKTLTELASVVVGELEARRKALKVTRELEQRLRQAQKMEAIGNFTSGIAHDFNHALSVIQVNADLLNRKYEHESKARVHVERIQNAIGTAKEITNQLLNWSRPDSSEFELVSLAQVVDEAMPLFTAIVPKGARIEYKNHAGAGHVFGNRGQIKQVLLNLIGNAKDAMEKTTGTISLVLTQSNEPSDVSSIDSVILTVTDQGCGMPQEILHRIHDPYFTTKPPAKGTGLGLWNVQGIVKAHNGTMSVTSEVDQGTQFEIVFPGPDASDALHEQSVLGSDNKEGDKKSTDVSQVPAEPSPKHVLVVDDEPLLANGISEELEFAGFRVTQFGDGKSALEYFKANPDSIDLIITDQLMPEMAGDKLIEEIRTIDSKIKTIICSGILDSTPLSGNQKPADFYLKKPFRLQKLLDTVASAIAQE